MQIKTAVLIVAMFTIIGSVIGMIAQTVALVPLPDSVTLMFALSGAIFGIIVVVNAIEESESTTGSTCKSTGTVNFFNETGGYGYISPDYSGEDVFFSMEDIRGPALREGQRVAFETVHTDQGPRARNLERR